MDRKKRNIGHKPFESFIQEMASESMLKAPPPTPCLCLKQKSGSVPDVRVIDILQKDKSCLKMSPCRITSHAISSHRKSILKSLFESDGRRPSSDHSLSAGTSKFSQWLVLAQGPTTSHLLHSVRQKLLNL
ncbi:UNVERIFIED_CONTAM: hypothetical protein PYX00_003805 [Menopon gallinae]|uniref:Uncharacterized protein n=1 Tax=Menopon gallinae TaxID=328185 RepID=A0AAW2I2Q1_9NEOP